MKDQDSSEESWGSNLDGIWIEILLLMLCLADAPEFGFIGREDHKRLSLCQAQCKSYGQEKIPGNRGEDLA